MHSFIPSRKNIRFATTFAVLSIALYFSGLIFTKISIKKAIDLYYDVDSQFFKERRFLAIKSVVEENKIAIMSLDNFLVKQGDEVKFIKEIETMAKNSGVKSEIISIDVKASSEDLLKEDVGVKIKFDGSWNSVFNFVDNLRKMPFGVSIKKISLDTGETSGWTGFVEIIVFREKQ